MEASVGPVRIGSRHKILSRGAACQLCRKRKLKCSGEHPCASCDRLGFACVFDKKKHSQQGRSSAADGGVLHGTSGSRGDPLMRQQSEMLERSSSSRRPSATMLDTHTAPNPIRASDFSSSGTSLAPSSTSISGSTPYVGSNAAGSMSLPLWTSSAPTSGGPTPGSARPGMPPNASQNPFVGTPLDWLLQTDALDGADFSNLLPPNVYVPGSAPQNAHLHQYQPSQQQNLNIDPSMAPPSSFSQSAASMPAGTQRNWSDIAWVPSANQTAPGLSTGSMPYSLMPSSDTLLSLDRSDHQNGLPINASATAAPNHSQSSIHQSNAAFTSLQPDFGASDAVSGMPLLPSFHPGPSNTDINQLLQSLSAVGAMTPQLLLDDAGQRSSSTQGTPMANESSNPVPQQPSQIAAMDVESPAYSSTASTASASTPSQAGASSTSSLFRDPNIVDAFFEHIHPILPFLHKRRFRRAIAKGTLEAPLECIVLQLGRDALRGEHSAARRPSTTQPAAGSTSLSVDTDATLTASTYQQTVRLVREAADAGSFTLQLVQACMLLCLYQFGNNMMSQCWLSLGLASRIAFPLGLHQLDSGRVTGFAPAWRSRSEKEEARRTMWQLIVLDRILTIGVGWPLSIRESDLYLDYPVSEEMFQESDLKNAPPNESPQYGLFGEYRILPRAVAPPTMPMKASQASGGGLPGAEASPSLDAPVSMRDTNFYVLLTVQILGRIVQLHNQPSKYQREEPATAAAHETEFESLSTALTTVMLSLPPELRYIGSEVGGGPGELGAGRVLILLSMGQILLYHPTVQHPTENSTASKLRQRSKTLHQPDNRRQSRSGRTQQRADGAPVDPSPQKAPHGAVRAAWDDGQGGPPTSPTLSPSPPLSTFEGESSSGSNCSTLPSTIPSCSLPGLGDGGGFQRCLNAAKQIVSVVRDMRGSPLPADDAALRDPMIGIALFLAVRILISDWVESQHRQVAAVEQRRNPRSDAEGVTISAVSSSSSSPIAAASSSSASRTLGSWSGGGSSGPGSGSAASGSRRVSLPYQQTAHLRAHIDLICRALERMAEAWPLGNKYLSLVASDLTTKVEDVARIKVGRGNYIDNSCKTSYVSDGKS
ncbi:hypothetical protein A4X09_0g6722 [Tilletia walkeri]|uniref:Zn(2)-C6 fungal-type domain-containing protein n=1 Tax=Tilletia walkeri TaxID=117179 RepID=A0A8X7N291_9BASI|nr:hypothetical protein A4X09_0g6722 [Tilletia walkeri]